MFPHHSAFWSALANLLLAKHSDQHWPTFFLQSILIITGQYYACKAFWSALANLLIAMHSDQHWPTFLLQNILISTGQPSSCKAFWSAMANLSLVKHCDLKTLTTFCFFLSVELIKQLLIKANICQSFLSTQNEYSMKILEQCIIPWIFIDYMFWVCNYHRGFLTVQTVLNLRACPHLGAS